MKENYIFWLSNLVGSEKCSHYEKLIYFLDDVPFTFLLTMDANRIQDGLDLRYRFQCDCGYSDYQFNRYFQDKECSVLEMMVALAIRLEEHIMYDPDIGNRTSKWFWLMIENLGLLSMDDSHFDIEYVENVVQRFLEREYNSNGQGGLFVIDNLECDLRDVEIWYQACWYLTLVVIGEKR